MDSFPLSDLNWAQKYICKIKTDTKKKKQEEPCKLHANSTSSSCSTDCSNAKAVLLKVTLNVSDSVSSQHFCFYCGIKWIHTNIKHLLILWTHNDKQESHQHVVNLVEMLCFTIWCLMTYLYSPNFDFDRIPPFTYQISFINQQTIFLFYQVRCALKSASPPWWGYKWLSHAGCT